MSRTVVHSAIWFFYFTLVVTNFSYFSHTAPSVSHSFSLYLSASLSLSLSHSLSFCVSLYVSLALFFSISLFLCLPLSLLLTPTLVSHYNRSILHYNRSKKHFFPCTLGKGKLAVVVSDDSLAFGVNMPFRTCIFTGEMSGELTPLMAQQMSGRAGRRGLDTQGKWWGYTVRKGRLKRVVSESLAKERKNSKGRRGWGG